MAQSNAASAASLLARSLLHVQVCTPLCRSSHIVVAALVFGVLWKGEISTVNCSLGDNIAPGAYPVADC